MPGSFSHHRPSRKTCLTNRLDHCRTVCDGHPLAPVLLAACRAAIAGGAVLKDFAGRGFAIRHKGAIDLVTEADVAAENIVIRELEASGPAGIAFLAEESGGPKSGSQKTPLWIIDPLDGTTNFAHGFPWYAVSIGYLEAGKMMAGVVYNVPFDELFIALSGHGAWANGTKLQVSAKSDLTDSLLATGFPYDTTHSAVAVAQLGKILPLTQGIRRAGSAALDLAMVAAGRLDGYWESHLKPWDIAAGSLLVEEAGGTVTNGADQGFDPFCHHVVATNGLLHRHLVPLLHAKGNTPS